jgi:glucokinase
MSQEVAIGVDIGGTKIAFALVSRTGEALLTHRLSTPVADGPDAVFAQVVKGVLHLINQTDDEVVGIGIGSPGHLNPHTGIVYNATNLFWRDIPLLDGIRRYLPFDLPLWLQKDANASLLGESLFGAAQGYRDFVMLTIGTGLGGSALVEGLLVNGADFSGMEIGHMPLDASGRMCRCGMHGCPEMYVSGVGLLAGIKEYLPEHPESVLASMDVISTEAMLDAFASHDPLAVRVMEEATDWLASVMLVCMGTLNPGLFVIGGGLGHAAFDYFSTRTTEKLQTRTRREIHQAVPIVESQILETAIGPACLVWHELGLKPVK